MAAAEVPRIDPITFEVIRNALVAATDEMVLTLKRSAYSTNIKTRSDFSCAFFDAELRCSAQGFAQPVHLGSMVEQVPRAVRDYGPENLHPGDAIITNDPYPSGVHLNDVSLISPVLLRRRAARLRRQPRPPRRRRRRRARPASAPSARCSRRASSSRRSSSSRPAGSSPTSSGSCSPRSAPSTRPAATSARRSPPTRPASAGCRRSSSASGARRSSRRWTSCSPTPSGAPAPSSRRCPHGVYEAEGSVDSDGYSDEPVRLAPGSTITAGRCPLRPDGLRPPAPGAGQLDLRADVLGLRLCPQVPRRPGPARERRLLPARHGRRAAAAASPTAPGRAPSSAAGRRRRALVEVHLPGPAARPCPSGCCAGTKGMMCQAGFGGLDSRPAATPASTRPSPAGTARGSRATAPTPSRRTARTPRTRPIEETELNYPVRIDRALARRGLGGARALPRRPRAAQGLPLRPPDDLHDPGRPGQGRAVGRIRRPRRRTSPSTC